MQQIRVLVVDDSAFMRKMLTTMMEKDPAIKVVGTAKNGQDALEQISALQPDLVTMDIEMPIMDGLTALEQIMERTPVPVIMVSSLTTEGAEATLKALDLGALDFIAKQTSFVSTDIVKIEKELIHKVKLFARKQPTQRFRIHRPLTEQRVSKRVPAAPPASVPQQPPRTTPRRAGKARIIAIGTSTGGPPALQAVLTRLPAATPVPIVIVQHMPPAFTGPLAKRLNSLCAIEVREAQHGDVLQPGLALLAPGAKHMTIKAGRIQLSDLPDNTLHKPSVDVMAQSVCQEFGASTLGVIMTGMGNDGLQAFRMLYEMGGSVIAQSAETCVVYGMPRAVVEHGVYTEIADLQDIAARIQTYW